MTRLGAEEFNGYVGGAATDLPWGKGLGQMILGGCDRLSTGELVPRRSRSDALNVEMLSLLAQVSRLTPVEPPAPAMISFEPTELDELGLVLASA